MREPLVHVSNNPARLRKRLRIGIDARPLREQRTGVERMAYHFITNLSRVSSPHEFVLFVDGPVSESIPLPHQVVVEALKHPALQRVFDFWVTAQVRALIRAHDIDLFFSPNTKFPFGSVPCVTTVHGLEWAFYPAGYRRIERLKQRFWFDLASRKSVGLVTFARNTAEDIRKLRPGGRTPVCVVPEGVGEQFRRLGPEEFSPDLVTKLGAREPFILSVCSLEPRKNIDRLIMAFARLIEGHGLRHDLVLVGRQGWKSDRLHRLADDLGVADRVRFTGHVSDEELVRLYNKTDLFVYPSLYEGFGLPLLEAMACGAPVVASNRSSLPEVAGDAAIVVDPMSETELADAMARVLHDRDLRASLVEKGYARASTYSWETMTRRIHEFIESVAGAA